MVSVDSLAKHREFFLRLCLPQLDNVEVISSVTLDLVNAERILKIKWERFNLVRELHIDLLDFALGKPVYPVFEFSSRKVFFCLRNHCEALLKSNFVDEFLCVIKFFDTTPLQAWIVSHRQSYTLQEWRRECDSSAFFIVSAPLHLCVIMRKIVHIGES